MYDRAAASLFIYFSEYYAVKSNENLLILIYTDQVIKSRTTDCAALVECKSVYDTSYFILRDEMIEVSKFYKKKISKVLFQ